MNFKRLADGLNELVKKRNKSIAIFDGCRVPMKKIECKDASVDRVSFKYKGHNRRISLTSPSVEVKTNEETKDNVFYDQKTIHQHDKDGNIKTDFLTPLEKLMSVRPSKKIVDLGGGLNRPGILRSKPINFSRPRANVHMMKDASFKANLLKGTLISSSSCESTEFYDDRSPVFGGWSSYSRRNTCARLCLSKLGSSNSNLDYGGEEGAKPFGSFNGSDVSKAKSFSEGPTKIENHRPRWYSKADDASEVNDFTARGFSEQSSSIFYPLLSKQKSLDQMSYSDYTLSPNLGEDRSPSPEVFKIEVDNCAVSENIMFVL